MRRAASRGPRSWPSWPGWRPPPAASTPATSATRPPGCWTPWARPSRSAGAPGRRCSSATTRRWAAPTGGGSATRWPGWAPAGGVPAVRERLADPATRRRLGGDLARRERGEPLPGERDLDPASVVLADVPGGPLERHRGRSLASSARDEGTSVSELVLRLLDGAPAGVPIVWHGMDEGDVRTVLAHPLVAGASDGWTVDPALGGVPHPRSYGTFVRVLGRYAGSGGVLSLEAAVRKMTSLPARRLGLADRGTIATGMAADLVVFDPERVIDRATYERPHAFCDGVHHVVVNGQMVIDDGEDTGAPAGRVLRHAPPQPPPVRAPG